jgi:hypothetical protein
MSMPLREGYEYWEEILYTIDQYYRLDMTRDDFIQYGI